MQLRKVLDLHVNLVHGFNIAGVPSRFSDVDVVVIRRAPLRSNWRGAGRERGASRKSSAAAVNGVLPPRYARLTLLTLEREAELLHCQRSLELVLSAGIAVIPRLKLVAEGMLQEAMKLRSGAVGLIGCGSGGAARAQLRARRRHGRENTEGEYSGLEHEVVEDVIESIKARPAPTPRALRRGRRPRPTLQPEMRGA